MFTDLLDPFGMPINPADLVPDNDPHRDDEALEGWIDAAQLVEAD